MSATSNRSTVVLTDQQAESITRSEELAYELRINEVMTRNVRAASPDMQMKDVVEIFRKTGISGMPVTDDGHLVGIISMEDIFHCLMEGDLDASTTQYMTRNPYTVKDVDLLVEALKVFVATGVGRLPVIDTDGKLAVVLPKVISLRTTQSIAIQNPGSGDRRYRASHLFEVISVTALVLFLRGENYTKRFVRGGSAFQ